MTLLAETILMNMLESDGYGHSVAESKYDPEEIYRALRQLRTIDDRFRELAASLGRIEKILNA